MHKSETKVYSRGLHGPFSWMEVEVGVGADGDRGEGDGSGSHPSLTYT